MKNFIESASRETSTEIMEAITDLAHDEKEAIEIWEAPTEEQLLAIWERVTRNGLFSAEDFYWGVTENTWAENIKA